MTNFTQILKNKALEMGFLDFGVAKSETLDSEFSHFQNWIDNNYNASMNWIANNPHKRQNPANVLEDCKSVIILTYNYYTDFKHPKEIENKGKISRYAWGNDYHDIILPKLKELQNFIKSNYPESETRAYVDTGPILEKIWAEKAGIGWQGKNSLIISKKHGSYFFLAVILTTLELNYNEPYKDYCASCSKCIKACPTDAIIHNKVVDSNKCLSYWTIEAKPDQDIPENIAQNSKNWLFGCDICQEVCPWNKNLPIPTNEIKFHPRQGETYIEIDIIKNMSQEYFSKRFKQSPIKRTKLKGIQRNAEQLNFKK